MGLSWNGHETLAGAERRRAEHRRRNLRWCRCCWLRAARPGSDACPDCWADLEAERAAIASSAESKARREA